MRAAARQLDSQDLSNSYDSPASAFALGEWEVRFDPVTGDASLIALVGRTVASPAFALELREEEVRSTSWVLAPTGDLLHVDLVEPPRIVRQDRFRTVVRTVSRSAWSTFIRELTRYRDADRVDLELRVDWQDSAGPESPVVVRSSCAHEYEAVAEATREFCMHDWVNLEGGSGG